MKLNRFGAVLGVLSAGALALSGCGSDNNGTGAGATSGSSSGKVSCGGAKTLKASGSTAQANAMTRFVNAFEHACPGQTLNYTANGSGAGISEFNGKQTDFGGSDSPLAPNEYTAAQQRCGSPALNLPVVFGPIAVTYNVTGVNSLSLDGATAAKIFNGAITTWNDPAIRRSTRASRCPPSRFTSSSATMNPAPPTISRSTSMPPPTVRGAKARARPSRAVSARGPRATTAPPRRSRPPKDRSPTTNGRLLRRRN